MRLRRFLLRLVLCGVMVVLPINLFMMSNLDEELGGTKVNTSLYPWGPNFHDTNLHVHLHGVYRNKFTHARLTHKGDRQTANVTVLLVSFNTVKVEKSSTSTSSLTPPAWILNVAESNQSGSERMRQIKELWPSLEQVKTNRTNMSDRILEQLNYVTKETPRDQGGKEKLKTILAWNMRIGRGNSGRKLLLESSCPVTTCTIAPNGNVEAADAVVFHNLPPPKDFVRWKKGRDSVWVWYELESPFHSSATHLMDNQVNWTANYRRDSTLVTPYERFVPFQNQTKSTVRTDALPNYAANKTGIVAWFVSNCKDKSGRLKFAKELSKYISVDIYGNCGNLTCPRKKSSSCFNMLNNVYKFYLSFENSACRDYITEKFYWNALQNKIVPIVLGAHPDDYAAVAPPHSYIHVDDFDSIQDLAEYLHKLNTNDHLYNEYLRWKGTGSFINTKFWCRLCGMLHAAEEAGIRQWYPSVRDWSHQVTGSGGACLPVPSGYQWASWRKPKLNATSLASPDMSSKKNNTNGSRGV